MNRLKILIATVLITLVMVTGHSQTDNRKEGAAKIEAKRSAYISERLNLSVEEAQAFFPVYHEYQTKVKALRPDRGSKMSKSDQTEEQAKDKINQLLARDAEMTDLKRTYFKRMALHIGYQKVLLLLKAEHEFKREVLNRYRERRQKRKEK